MLLALGDRQTLSVWPQPTGEHGVAIDDEMLRRDRCRDPSAANEVCGVGGGDMFEHDLELGKVADDSGQDAVDEHGLAVEHVDFRVGNFTVYAQHHPDLLYTR